MEEYKKEVKDKEPLKIRLSTIFRIIVLLIILAMSGTIYYLVQYKLKGQTIFPIPEINVETEELEKKIDNLNKKMDALQNSLDKIGIENTSNNSKKVENDESNSSNSNIQDNKNLSTDTENSNVELLTISKLKKINSEDKDALKNFFEVYTNKNIKISGYVLEITKNPKFLDKLCVSIGEQDSLEINVLGITNNNEIQEKLNEMKKGDKITLTGIVQKDEWPLVLELSEIEK